MFCVEFTMVPIILILATTFNRSLVGADTNISHILHHLLIDYDRRLRPDPDGPATNVSLIIHGESLGPLREQTMDISGTFYIGLKWFDTRLQYSGEKGVTLKGDDTAMFWQPDLYFKYETKGFHHDIIHQNRLLRIKPTGMCEYALRISVTLACNMKLNRFPFDSQTCPMYMSSFAYSSEDVVLTITDDDVNMDERIVVSKHDLVQLKTATFEEQHENEFWSVVRIDLTFQRQLQTYLLTVYVPSLLLVVISWMSFWIDAHAAPARVSLGITTVMTSTTMTASMQEIFPHVTGPMAIDIWLAACLLFVFLSLIEYAMTNYLITKNERKKISQKEKALGASSDRTVYNNSDKDDVPNKDQNKDFKLLTLIPHINISELNEKTMDRSARIVFAGAFLVFNLVYWTYFFLLDTE